MNEEELRERLAEMEQQKLVELILLLFNDEDKDLISEFLDCNSSVKRENPEIARWMET